MAFRRTSVRRSVRGARKRALWINVPFSAINFTEVAVAQLLVAPEDWEAQFSGNGNETAVLRAVVGELVWSQTTAGTAGGNGFWGIYIADSNSTVVPTFSSAGMSEVDWLRTGARKTSATVTASAIEQTFVGTQSISIMAKRKLKSRDAIFIVGQYAADAASPAGTLSGLLRFLIARD